jgi:phospholipid transport system substrate-binding protein
MKMSSVTHVIFVTVMLCCFQGYTVQAQSSDVSVSDNSTSNDKSSKVQDFINKIGNEIINILVHRSQPLEARKKAFRSILDRDFDMPSIGKFVIARYWRGMDSSQQKEYLHLFVQAVVENYAAQFDNYQNEKLVVSSSRQTEDGGYVVSSAIIRPGKGQPLKVEWKVFKTPRGMKVLDIVIDGVSMSITLRSEYSAVFNERGGVGGVISYLREKCSDTTKTYEPSTD